MGTGVADGAVFVSRLDAFGDDHCAELHAKTNDAAHELLTSYVTIEVRHELAIELHHLGLEIGDPTEVRIARAKVVDDEMNAAARPHLTQYIVTKLKMCERHGFGDLQKNFVVVREDGIVGAYQPAIA